MASARLLALSKREYEFLKTFWSAKAEGLFSQLSGGDMLEDKDIIKSLDKKIMRQ